MTAARTLAALLAALLLAACGGGDADEDEARAGTQPPACTTQPEVCR